MSEIVTIILPFFGLLGLGVGAARYPDLTREGVAGLNLFVFYFAVPALFFRSVAATPIGALSDWSFVFTTTFATYCAFAIAFSIGALLNRGNVPEATIHGLAGSYANIGALGPGLALSAFGPAAGAPMALIFSFDHAMLFALVPLMMSLGGTERMKGRDMGRAIGREVFLHPFVVATIAGFLVAAIGLKMPAAIDGALTFLGSAAAPCALFALGATLAREPAVKMAPDLPVLVAVKLVAHPLIVYLLLGWIGGFDKVWIYTAVLLAALPPATNVLVLARRYQVLASRASAAIVVGTVASLVTVTVIVSLLVAGALPPDPFY